MRRDPICYVEVKCDKCKHGPDVYFDFGDDPDEAVDEYLEENDWWVTDSQDYCSQCKPKEIPNETDSDNSRRQE